MKAVVLGLSPQTAETHVRPVLHKPRVPSRGELRAELLRGVGSQFAHGGTCLVATPHPAYQELFTALGFEQLPAAQATGPAYVVGLARALATGA